MPRFKLTIEYAGTRYSGWQIQQNARTVQGELARAVRAVTSRDHPPVARLARGGVRGEPRATGRGDVKFELYGSGRTDAGVHALAQVAHLDVATTLRPPALRDRLNDELPADINILRVDIVSHKFHARHSAVSRAYVYQIARRRTAFAKPFVWWIREPLDADAMRDAAARLTGLRDFRAFTDDDPEEKSTKALVEELRVEEAGALLLIHISGSHFLWKMVRRIVGVLAAVGRGELTAGDVEALLDPRAEPSPLPAKLTAPASGLFLARVTYPGDPPAGPIRPVLSLDDPRERE